MNTVIAAWCYYGNRKKNKILLISSSAQNWIIPKGQVEKHQKKHRTALKEAWEEGGVEGKLIGSSSNFVIKRNGKAKWIIFPIKILKIKNSWPEMKYRKRQFVKLKKAAKIIRNDDLVKAVRKMSKKIRR